MGRPMDDLHAPTVASGPTSSWPRGDSEKRMSLQELMARKDAVWSELTALGSVLDSHGVNMNTSLTTFDGYPRSDIDVAQVRTTRARIIVLRNDYKDLMSRIEVALQDHWATAAANPAPPAAQAQSNATAPAASSPSSSSAAHAGASAGQGVGAALEAPFAKVNSVVASSPAASAGLRPGDKITLFGHVNWMNHEKLSKVAQVVQQNEGREIAVKVIRPAEIGGGDERLEMRLTPSHNWGGRGMLGCHLLPL